MRWQAGSLHKCSDQRYTRGSYAMQGVRTQRFGRAASKAWTPSARACLGARAPMGCENSGNGSIGPCFPLSTGTAALDLSSTEAARLAGACDVGLVDALPTTPPIQPVASGSDSEVLKFWEISQKLDMLTSQEKQVVAFRETVRKVAKGLWDRLWRARPEAVAAAAGLFTNVSSLVLKRSSAAGRCWTLCHISASWLTTLLPLSELV